MSLLEERYVLIENALKFRVLTTVELELLLRDANSGCPDDLARTLNIMRRKGLIKGAVSHERGCWVWWVEE